MSLSFLLRETISQYSSLEEFSALLLICKFGRFAYCRHFTKLIQGNFSCRYY